MSLIHLDMTSTYIYDLSLVVTSYIIISAASIFVYMEWITHYWSQCNLELSSQNAVLWRDSQLDDNLPHLLI